MKFLCELKENWNKMLILKVRIMFLLKKTEMIAWKRNVHKLVNPEKVMKRIKMKFFLLVQLQNRQRKNPFLTFLLYL